MAGPTLQEVEQESVADTMKAVYAEQTGKQLGEVIEETPDAPLEPVAVETDATEQTAAERARDPATGRFAKTDAPADVRADVPQPADAPADEELDELEPPTDWSLEDQNEFRALPNAKAKKWHLARDAAARTATADAQALQGRFQPLESVLGPRRDSFARDGLDDAAAVRQIFSLSDFAARDKVGFARWFAQARGIGPQELFPELFQQQGQPDDDSLIATDPLFQREAQRIDRIEGMLSTWQQEQQAQAQQYEYQQQASLIGEIQSFAGAKDDKGRLTHPYFEDVRRFMGQFIGSGEAKDVQSAYDMACRAHPEVYAKINAANEAKAAAERAKAQREKAASARNAGSSIAGTPGDRTNPADTGDIREDMRRIAIEKGVLSS